MDPVLFMAANLLIVLTVGGLTMLVGDALVAKEPEPEHPPCPSDPTCS